MTLGKLGTNLHLGCSYLEAKNHGGLRDLKALPPKYVVIHSTESPNQKGSAQAVANFLHTTDRDSSSQIVVDDYTCVRCLHDEVIPYAAPPFNTRGLHIEQCGYAAWSRAEWFKHRPTIDRAAKATAYWAKAYGIPIRFLTPTACKSYRSGITCHRNVSEAFGLSDHTDPGPTDNKHYPYDYFLTKVKDYFNGL